MQSYKQNIKGFRKTSRKTAQKVSKINIFSDNDI